MSFLLEILEMVQLQVIIEKALTYVTAVGLILGLIKYFLDEGEKKSLFYLNEIKANFEKSTQLIFNAGNDNIVWHSAIDLLRAGQTLSKKLKRYPHKKIYIDYYIHTAYSICQVVNSVDSLRFFYGIPDYQSKTAEFLFAESVKKPRINTFSHSYLEPPDAKYDYNNRIFAVSTEKISYLVRFLMVCNKHQSSGNDNCFFQLISEREMSQQEATDCIAFFRLMCLYTLDFQGRMEYVPKEEAVSLSEFPRLMAIR